MERGGEEGGGGCHGVEDEGENGGDEEEDPDFKLRRLRGILLGREGKQEKKADHKELEDERNKWRCVEEQEDCSDENGHRERIEHILDAVQGLRVNPCQ